MDLSQYNIVGEIAIHEPTQARFFAQPGQLELVNWDWGHAESLDDEYDRTEMMRIAAQPLSGRLSLQR